MGHLEVRQHGRVVRAGEVHGDGDRVDAGLFGVRVEDVVLLDGIHVHQRDH